MEWGSCRAWDGAAVCEGMVCEFLYGGVGCGCGCGCRGVGVGVGVGAKVWVWVHVYVCAHS